MSAELVRRTASQMKSMFKDGSPVPADQPRNTLDERYLGCTDHHTGCVCWEAERNEDLLEVRGELDRWGEVAKKVLAGHLLFVDSRDPAAEREAGCQCTGCQIVRECWWPGKFSATEQIRLLGGGVL